MGAALLVKHALPVMQAAGRIVNIDSRAAVTNGAGFAYSVSEAGVLHLVTMAPGGLTVGGQEDPVAGGQRLAGGDGLDALRDDTRDP